MRGVVVVRNGDEWGWWRNPEGLGSVKGVKVGDGMSSGWKGIGVGGGGVRKRLSGLDGVGRVTVGCR